ncbi:hypothetical protein ACVILI_004341 [Mesorhizobium sp. USDA 4775]
MVERFTPSDFLRRIARRLVAEFDDASVAGTPSLIGSAREHPARAQLERILPGYVGVGSGIVIDSYGGMSQQQDVVIFERNICPVFDINGSPEATYYPAEGVIAVGEIKSSLNTTTLTDAFAKVRSVKRLRRHSVLDPDALCPPSASFRHYGGVQAVTGTPDESFDQQKHLDQIYGFALFGTLGISEESALSRAALLWKENTELSPSVILTLSSGFLMRSSGASLSDSPADEAVLVAAGDRGFGHLVQRLTWHSRQGRTVPTSSFQRYLRDNQEVADRFSIRLRQTL